MDGRSQSFLPQQSAMRSVWRPSIATGLRSKATGGCQAFIFAHSKERLELIGMCRGCTSLGAKTRHCNIGMYEVIVKSLNMVFGCFLISDVLGSPSKNHSQDPDAFAHHRPNVEM